MGEKELIINTPLLDEYVEGDEEALETSFQALEIVGTTSSEAKGRHHKPSRVAIMVAKVPISNGFEPGKGLGRKLDGMTKPVAIQENSGRSKLGYKGATRKGKPGRKARQRENSKVEALIELKRLLEQEESRLQSKTEELETINLGDREEKRNVLVGKQMPPSSREYFDIFAWSYRDMPGLDTAIVEHRLPLIPNAVPVRQQLGRMKPEMALKIKEEVEKQWNANFLALAKYSQWVANIVPVPKKDRKV
ncbi:hypothetical protein CR513_10991, partial [Mucuna pruriens]